MAGLYPSLEEKFKSEGICPICMMSIQTTPKYSCVNGHAVCHRCKPYYFACPTCQLSLDVEIQPPEVGQYHMPPAMHYMPHPYPPYPQSTSPSAPFIDSERHWGPPVPPTESQQLHLCKYSYLGCYTKIPEHLRELHESRCQFRPNLEEENLPTDLCTNEGALQNCKYSIVGCNVKLCEWRKVVHEKTCIYKDRLESLDDVQYNLSSLSFEDGGDPEEMVDCKYYRHGCMVKMPRRRKQTHEQKCNYLKYHQDDSFELISHESHDCETDPDEKVSCRWSNYGCQVQPRQCRKEIHEDKCNYRRERCGFSSNGCYEMVEPCKRHIHESSCTFNY